MEGTGFYGNVIPESQGAIKFHNSADNLKRDEIRVINPRGIPFTNV